MKKSAIILSVIMLIPVMLVSFSIPADTPPVVSDVQIIGAPRSGTTVYGVYTYFDAEGEAEGSSVWKWYSSSNSDGSGYIQIAGANAKSYKVSDLMIGRYIGFSVKPEDADGDQSDSTYFAIKWFGPVINDPPDATSVAVSGSKLVNEVLTGNYVYSDTEGDVESGSTYKWYSSAASGGPWSEISGENGRAHVIRMTEQGMWFRFGVVPKALTGNDSFTEVLSLPFGRANSMPSSDVPVITGTLQPGHVLKADYNYYDADGDTEGNSAFQWYREMEAIPGANDTLYTLNDEDVDSRIRFSVKPVSSTGFPDTGDTILSSFTAAVTDPSNPSPLATDLCISGILAEGEVLKGEYHYVNKYKEKDSEYRWYRDAIMIQSGITPAFKSYVVDADDIGHQIKFAVIPRNKSGQSGSITYSDPFAYFTLPRESFSSSDPDVELSAAPSGGAFWGEGVTNGIFSPSSVDFAESPFTVHYQVNIEKPNTECLQQTSADLIVSSVALMFGSFRNIYCQNGGNDTIFVMNVPAGATSKQFRLTDTDAYVSLLNDTTIVIDPGKMRAGNKEDTLYFQAMDGLQTLKYSRPFIIDTVTQVTILNLPPMSRYCDNIAPFELLVSHPGGSFDGPVVGNFFNPALASGNTTVRYTFTSARGCVSTADVPVTINPSPVASFGLADVCIESFSDTTIFINKTKPAGIVSKWLWEFLAGGDTISSTLKNPGYLYTSGGTKRVILTATTAENCVSQLDSIIDLGVKPEADFFWKNECMVPADSIWLFDATTSFQKIVARSWNFFDGDSLRTIVNPRYPKKASGYLPVEYIVKTKYQGCHDTVSKNIFIRPTIAIGSDDYLENFENGSGGWVKDYADVNSWAFGTPDRTVIKSAASGDSAWFTRYSIADQKVESSAVISPCFDFTFMARPMISLKLWKRFDTDRDGLALQYTIGDSGKWIYVGSLDDGINWYNSALISGSPGVDNQMGWTGTATGYIEASHKLDNVAGEKNVKLRLAYGTDGTSRGNDGVAFDDIRIGERTRVMLLEHFTNNRSAAAIDASERVTELSEKDTADIINIQYHTNFPGSDSFYSDNPGDISGRLIFYGLAGVPFTFIDGGTGRDYSSVFDYRESDLDIKDLAKRSLKNPLFDIDLKSEVTGGVLTVSGNIRARETLNAENVTLYLAVTEKNRYEDGANHFNIFRKFIPDAGGISLRGSWTKDEEYVLAPLTWVIENIQNNSDINVIAFVQNNNTKEIYQAASQHDVAKGTGTKNEAGQVNDKFALYPNPASDRLTVSFGEQAEAGTEIRIYDTSGKLVRSYKPGTGAIEYMIENPGLRNGIYLVKIAVYGKDRGYKKLVIREN